MEMGTTTKFIVSVLAFTITRADFASAACGTALPKGSIVCNIEQDGQLNLVLLESTRCTHAAIAVDVKCENDTCKPMFSTEIELIQRFLPPEVHRGMYIRFDGKTAKFLSNGDRQIKTSDAFVDFMADKNFTFVFFNEYTWEDGFIKNQKKRNYFDFLKIFQLFVHKRKWHLGIGLQVGWTHLQATYDLEDLAKYVDWFNVAAHHNKVGSEFYYFHLFTPLVSSTNDGTVKYWIEHVLQWLKPECVLLEVSGRVDGFTVESKGLEPGPGSRVISPLFRVTTYRQICSRLLGVNCREFWDEEKKIPWTTCGNECFTYDNARSAKLKAEFAKSYNLTGMVYWSLSNDDEEGICGHGPFPMLEALRAIQD